MAEQRYTIRKDGEFIFTTEHYHQACAVYEATKLASPGCAITMAQVSLHIVKAYNRSAADTDDMTIDMLFSLAYSSQTPRQSNISEVRQSNISEPRQ